jgi:hypothetical protein
MGIYAIFPWVINEMKIFHTWNGVDFLEARNGGDVRGLMRPE